MFAGGEDIDVSQSSPFSFPNFIEQGLVEPLDDMPGIEDYVNDFTPFTKQVAQYDGQTMGLPYFSAIWVWNYYEDLLEKAGIDQPFTELRRADRAVRQGQAGRRVAVPDPLGRRRRPGAVAGHLVQPDLEPRRHVLRQGRRAPARRRLGRPRDPQMVGQHLRAGPRHLRSGIAQGPVHDLGESVQRRQQPLPRPEPPLRPEHRQRSVAVADRRQGEGARLPGRRPHHRRDPRLFPHDRQSRSGVGLEAAAVSRRAGQDRRLHAGAPPRAAMPCWAAATSR